jgi:homospermidine synthase
MQQSPHYTLIGCGIVGAGVLQHLRGDIIVIDKIQKEILPRENQNITFIHTAISQDNYIEILKAYSAIGTIVIETCVECCSRDLAQWCHKFGRNFLNTVGDAWLEETLQITDNFKNLNGVTHEYVRRLFPILTPSGPTCLLTHGANPGMVNHYLNIAVKELATSKQKSFEEIIGQIKEIYILEKDTLMFKVGFQPQFPFFYNSWNIHEFFLESIAHTDFPDKEGTTTFETAKNKDFFLDEKVIHGRIVGHEETFSMQYHLLTQFGKRCKIQFVYECSPIGEQSRITWKFGEPYQPKCATHELDQAGKDLVGTLVILEDGSNWFTGYEMTQKEAVDQFSHSNATAWYVSASVLAGVKWIENNRSRGILFPEQLSVRDNEEIVRSFLSYTNGKHYISKPIQHLFQSEDFNAYECFNLYTTGEEKVSVNDLIAHARTLESSVSV